MRASVAPWLLVGGPRHLGSPRVREQAGIRVPEVVRCLWCQPKITGHQTGAYRRMGGDQRFPWLILLTRQFLIELITPLKGGVLGGEAAGQGAMEG